MATLQKQIKNNILEILLFIIISSLYLYKDVDNFTFDIDTQYQALYAKTILDNFHIIWIGVSAGSTGFYLGPGLVYLTALLLWLSKGDPAILGNFSSFIGILTVGSIYYIGKGIFNRSTAIIATSIYGFSAFITNYHHKYWPIFIPIIGIWLFYSLVKSRENSKWLILTTILFGISFHIHLSILIFFPLIVWSFIKLKNKIDLKTWFFSISSFILIISPLIVFDFVHNFSNLLTPIRMIENYGNTNTNGLVNNLTLLINSVNKIWYWKANFSIFMVVVITFIYLLLLGFFLKFIKNKSMNLLVTIILLFFILLSLYPGAVQEYYVVFCFPFIALFTAVILNKVSVVAKVLILTIFIATNIIFTLSYSNPRGLTIKKNLINNVSSEISQDFYLDFEGEIDNEGWRYLFEAYGKIPSQSKADAMFGWLYPEKISNINLEKKITIKNGSDGQYQAIIE